MKIRQIPLAILLFTLPFLQGLQCDKYEGYEDVPPEHNFSESVSILPYRLTYTVGDTIWLRINIPNKKLFDENRGERILFESASFNSLAQVQLLYANPYVGDGPFVRFIYPQGISASTNNYSYNTQAVIKFGCAPSNDYQLALGMVLLKEGVFGIYFNTGSIEQCATNINRNSRLKFKFDVADTRKSFYQSLPFEAIGKKPDEYVLTALDKKEMVLVQVN